MLEFNTKVIVFFALFQLCGIILIPVSLYGIYKLWTFKHELFVIKRDISLTKLKIRTYFIFSIASFIAGNMFNVLEYNMRYFQGFSFILVIKWSCMLAGLIPVNWMRYYMNNWLIEMSNKKWKYIITGNNDDNWFIKHKNTYGSMKYIGKYLVILIMIDGLIVGIAAYYALGYMQDGIIVGYIICLLSASFVACIPLIFLVHIIKKIPEFEDSYFISNEHERCIKLLWLLCVLTLGVPVHIVISIFVLDTPMHIAGTDASVWISLSLFIVGSLLVISSTYMVIRDNSTETVKIMAVNSDSSNGGSGFRAGIRDGDILESFISQLIKEIAVENMMSYIEFNQFIKHNSVSMLNADPQTQNEPKTGMSTNTQYIIHIVSVIK